MSTCALLTLAVDLCQLGGLQRSSGGGRIGGLGHGVGALRAEGDVKLASAAAQDVNLLSKQGVGGQR